MVSNENNEEMSVNDILSSIKEVISSEQDLSKPSDDNEFIELTDVVDEDEESILLEDIVDLKNDTLSNDLTENLEKDNSLKMDNSSFISDLSIDDIVRETIKETLNDWFAKNLKTIVEESVKEEVAKLFKKRN
jgi:cell pole-organizing protein PopZ